MEEGENMSCAFLLVSGGSGVNPGHKHVTPKPTFMFTKKSFHVESVLNFFLFIEQK